MQVAGYWCLCLGRVELVREVEHSGLGGERSLRLWRASIVKPSLLADESMGVCLR